MHQGSCLCGAVRFEVSVPLPQPDACHCQECRKFSGHYFVSTDVPRSAVTVHGMENVTWYRTDKVRRGFCSTCGCSLFWDPPHDRDWTAIALGCFDSPTNTQISKHIWLANKGDYYEIADGITQYQQFPKG